jgi:hypothetical protein
MMAENSKVQIPVTSDDLSNNAESGEVVPMQLVIPADPESSHEAPAEETGQTKSSGGLLGESIPREEQGQESVEGKNENLTEPPLCLGTSEMSSSSEIVHENAPVNVKIEKPSPAVIPSTPPVVQFSESDLLERTQVAETRISKNALLQTTQSSTPGLLSLPIDSLHSVASFLFAVDWSAFGQCCKGSNRACREIYRRVRMHGFRCATEVVTAWVSLICHRHADLCFSDLNLFDVVCV